MKICLITEKYPPLRSGIGDYAFNLVQNIGDFSEVSIITSKEVSPSNNVYPVLSFNLFRSLVQTIKIIKDDNPDVLHFQSPESRKGLYIIMFPLILRLIFKDKCIVTTIHEYLDISLVWRIGMLPSILFSHHIIVVDEDYIPDMRKVLPLSSNKFSFIANANDTTQSVLPEMTTSIHNSLSSNGDFALMGFFGFVYPGKGIEIVLHVLSDLLMVGVLRTKFIIIGGISDINPEYADKIISLISSLNLSNWVYITGYLDKATVVNYLAAMDYFVFPFVNGYSLRNSSTMAVISLNKPFITTRRRGKKTLTAEGILYLENAEDKANLQSFILSYQDGDRDGFVTNYRTLDFSWKRVAKQHIELYNRLSLDNRKNKR